MKGKTLFGATGRRGAGARARGGCDLVTTRLGGGGPALITAVGSTAITGGSTIIGGGGGGGADGGGGGSAARAHAPSRIINAINQVRLIAAPRNR